MIVDCVYFECVKESEIHTCLLLDRCKITGGGRRIPSCDKCKRKLSINDPDFLKKWEDPLLVITKDKNRAKSLRGLLAGTPAFLIGGGPSANDLPLEKLNQRGVWSMCINNMAGHSKFRPQAFVCSDPPSKFSYSVWKDPAIMKFIPTPKLTGGRAKLRKKRDGKFLDAKEHTHDCPNVWGFQRDSWMFLDDSYFLSNGAKWGNLKVGVIKTGLKKTVNTMLLGIRIMRYLGCSGLFLIGIDFFMEKGYEYSFPQDKHEKACISNNNQFAVVNEWLCEMQKKGIFQRFGMPIFNCFEKSGLRAFPYVPFEKALECCIGEVEQEPDLVDYYLK